MRSVRHALANGPLALGQLLHQSNVGVQAAGRVADHHIRVILHGLHHSEVSASAQ